MSTIITSFAPMTFLFAILLVSIPQTESLLKIGLADPLAFAPTVDFNVDPSKYSAAPGEAPEMPYVTFEPNDPDFPGFTNSSQVLDILLTKCDAANGFSLNCGVAFHEVIFGKKLAKPTNECCHTITKEGKYCHDLLVRYVYRFEGPVYDRGTILKRSENLWLHCSRV